MLENNKEMVTGELKNCPDCRKIKCECPKQIGGEMNQIQTYQELIEWNLGRIIEPPYDKDLSDADEKWNSCIRSTISYLKGRIEELKK